ncbi:MAG: hypothetical protein VXX85_02440 [Candidatus Margulisiibacteriota bacterium]|nr:hypothetical protein [Candidatus Margulisiibacteriota bacterium]
MLKKIISLKNTTALDDCSEIQSANRFVSISLFLQDLSKQFCYFIFSILTFNVFFQLLSGLQTKKSDRLLLTDCAAYPNKLIIRKQGFDNTAISNEVLQTVLLFIFTQKNEKFYGKFFEDFNFEDFFNLKLDSQVLIKNYLYPESHDLHNKSLAESLKDDIMFRKLLVFLIKDSKDNRIAYESFINKGTIGDYQPSFDFNTVSISDSNPLRMFYLNSRTLSMKSNLSSLIQTFLFGSDNTAKMFILSTMAYQFSQHDDPNNDFKVTLLHNLIDELLTDVLPCDLFDAQNKLKSWFMPYFLNWAQSGFTQFCTKISEMDSNKNYFIKNLILSELKYKYPALLKSKIIEDYLQHERYFSFLLLHAPSLLLTETCCLTEVTYDFSIGFFSGLGQPMTRLDLFNNKQLHILAKEDPTELLLLLFSISRLMNLNDEFDLSDFEENYKIAMVSVLINSIFKDEPRADLLLEAGKRIYFWSNFTIQDLQTIFLSNSRRNILLKHICDFLINQGLFSDSKNQETFLNFLIEHSSNGFLKKISFDCNELDSLILFLMDEMRRVLMARGQLEKDYFGPLDLKPERLLEHINGNLINICQLMVLDNFKYFFETTDISFVNELLLDDQELLLQLSSKLEMGDNIAFKTMLQKLFIDNLTKQLKIDNRLIQLWLPYVPLPMLITGDFRQQLLSIQALNIKDMFKMPYSEHASYFKLAECIFLLNKEKQMMVLKRLNIGVINDFISSANIPDYIIHEMKIPQHILAKILLHFHKINKKNLLNLALEAYSKPKPEFIHSFSEQLIGQMPWEFFITIAKALGLTIGEQQDSDIVLSKQKYYANPDVFDKPQQIKFDLHGKIMPDFFAIATGILALNQIKKTRILEILHLKDYEFLLNKSLYLFEEFKMFQDLLIEAVLKHMKENRSSIEFRASKILEAELSKLHKGHGFNLQDEDLKPIKDFSYDGAMPTPLLIALGESLGLDIHIGINNPLSDIGIQKDGDQWFVEFPSQKIKTFDFNVPLDITHFKMSRFDQDMKLSQSLIDSGSLKIDDMRILYSNMLHKSHSKHKNIVPIFGVTQSGKTSLFNYILGIQSELNFRVGGGVTSETALYYQLEKGGVYYTDTPGLDDNRSEILEVLIHYQLFELLYSNQLSNILVTLTFSDLTKLSAGGNRSIIKFFSLFFNVKELGDGLYDRIYEKYFGKAYKEFFQSMIQKTLFNSHSEVIKSKWNQFFDEIEKNVESLHEIPFTFVIRDDFYFYSPNVSIVNLIDEAINKIKEDIVKNVIKNQGIMPLSLNNTLLLYLYYLFIKKDHAIAHLHSWNQTLLTSINKKKSCIYDLMYPIEKIFNTNGVRPLFETFFSDQILSQSKLIKDYFAFIKNLELAFKEIEYLTLTIANSTRKSEVNGSSLDQLDSKEIDMKAKKTEDEINSLKAEIIGTEEFILSIDSDEKIERDGWPEKKVAEGWLWKEVSFSHEKAHKDDINLSKGSYSKVNRFDTEVQVKFPYFWNDHSDDHLVTCHNFTTKRKYFGSEVKQCKENIDRIKTRISSLETQLDRLKDLRETFDPQTKMRLAESLQASKTLLITKLKELDDRFKSCVSNPIDMLINEEGNIKLIYNILKNTDLNVMQFLLRTIDKEDYFSLVERLLSHE